MLLLVLVYARVRAPILVSLLLAGPKRDAGARSADAASGCPLTSGGRTAPRSRLYGRWRRRLE